MASGSHAAITVAIVDDQQMFIDALRGLLALERDIEVVAATTDPHALADITADADVVLMDLVMPGADGLELTRQVRKRRPDQRVIVISGRTDNHVERDALEAGAAAFLVKGGLGSEVAETIRLVAARRTGS